MSNLIIAISSRNDPHIYPVKHHLDTLGHEMVLVDQAELPDNTITYTPGQGDLFIGGQHFTGAKAIWNRRSFDPHIRDQMNDGQRRFANNEFKEAFKGALAALCNNWYNHPEANRKASFKPLQLNLATRLNIFDIPRTLITSNKDHAIEFINSCKGAVAKCLGLPVIKSEKESGSVFTTLVNDEFMAVLDDLYLSPVIFQEFITKKYEVRVTVVGRDVHPCKMEVDKQEGTKLDWRKGDHTMMPHSIIELPAKIKDGCFAMCKYFGLSYAAFDFAVDENDNWLFFEVNPNGQWLWIEEMTGAPISRSFAELLAG